MAEDPMEFVSHDTNHLISSLLIYKLAAKLLTPAEINSVVDGGADTVSEQLAIHLDKNMVRKVTKDTAQNIKDLIHKMRPDYGDPMTPSTIN